jgi:ferredoxin-thioredoxin reductase catalytic subunit
MAMKKKDRTLQQTELFIQNAAKRNGWVANPDESFRRILAEGLTTNVNRHGYYLCPCRDGEGDRRADGDIVCPCIYATADIEEYGQCFCGLFLSKEKAALGIVEVNQIPERRPRSKSEPGPEPGHPRG